MTSFRPLHLGIGLSLVCLSGAACSGGFLYQVHGPGVDDVPGQQDSGTPADSDSDTGDGPGAQVYDIPTENIPGIDDPSDVLFNGEEIPVFQLEFSDEAWDDLVQTYYDYIYYGKEFSYVEASFTYEGQTWSPVGVRLKGQNSARNPETSKGAFKISFDEYIPSYRFLDRKHLTLNNMVSDYSMMHERLAYLVWREFGVPAARCSHAQLYIDGEYYGLMTNVETVDKQMIGRWFEDTSGTLFEGWDVDFKPAYLDMWQVEFGSGDTTNIKGVTYALQNSGEDALEEAGWFLDWQDFINYWAGGAVVGQFDGYPYSSPGDDFHVYDDPTTGKLWFIPHGADETFSSSTYTLTSVNGIVAVRCKEVTWCLNDWISATWDVLDMIESHRVDLLAVFDEVQAQIEPYVEADERKPYDMSQVVYYQDYMRSMIEGRAGVVESQLGSPPARSR